MEQKSSIKSTDKCNDLYAWLNSRSYSIARLREHYQKGLIDPDIADWLISFNDRCRNIFTTSSCSGRVVLFEGSSLLDKRGALAYVIYHDPKECHNSICREAELLSSRTIRGDRILWASLQPPIIQLATCELGVAWRILECAHSSGFIRSGVRRSRKHGFIAEIRAYDKLHVLLPAPCEILRSLCDVLAEYKTRLASLTECLTLLCND